MCLLVVLGSQGIVVKCAVTIFLRTVNYRLRLSNFINQLKMGGGGGGGGGGIKRLPCILAAILSRLRHSTVSASYLDLTVHANYFVARLLREQHCSLSVIDVFFFVLFLGCKFPNKAR